MNDRYLSKNNNNDDILEDLLDLSLLNTGRVFLSGDIDVDLSIHVIKSLRYLSSKGFSNVYLYLHTDGGDINDSLALIDEIVGHQKNGMNIIGVVLGQAYSAGALILSFCSERYATTNSTLMLHPVHYELPGDYINQQQNVSDFTTRQYKDFMCQVAKNCGRKTKVSIEKFCLEVKDGLWLTAKEAIKYGILDGFWDYKLEKGIDEYYNERTV